MLTRTTRNERTGGRGLVGDQDAHGDTRKPSIWRTLRLPRWKCGEHLGATLGAMFSPIERRSPGRSTAIVEAGVVGYSRLMSRDESGHACRPEGAPPRRR